MPLSSALFNFFTGLGGPFVAHTSLETAYLTQTTSAHPTLPDRWHSPKSVWYWAWGKPNTLIRDVNTAYIFEIHDISIKINTLNNFPRSYTEVMPMSPVCTVLHARCCQLPAGSCLASRIPSHRRSRCTLLDDLWLRSGVSRCTHGRANISKHILS